MNSKGVSEVIGALMLIVVVVVAVSALGYYLAIVQKEEMERESYLRFVKSENLSLVDFELFPNDRIFEIVNRTSGESYWISLKCERICEFQLCNQSCENIKIFGNKILRKMNASLESDKILLDHNGEWEVRIAKWNSLNLTVRNDNIQDSMLIAIKINGRWIKDWESEGIVYNHTSPLRIPARSTAKISANISSLEIERDEAILIELVSGVYNIFSFHSIPKNTEIEITMSKEEQGVYEREVLRFMAKNAEQKDVFWLFYFNTSEGGIIIPKKGLSMSYSPENLLPDFIKELCGLDFKNFGLQVIAIDPKGILSISEKKEIKAGDVNPPAFINVSYNQEEKEILVELKDLFGCDKKEEIVLFIPMGNITLNRTVAITDLNGNAVVSVQGSGNGVVTVKCRNLVKHLEIR